jgi:hypothetical protein
MHICKTLIAFGLFTTVHSYVIAADTPEPGRPSDSCIAAALEARPGILTGWQRTGGGPQGVMTITVLDKGDKMAETTCDPANPKEVQFKNKVGLYRYEMFARATLPEAEARAAAPWIFVGPISFYSMQLSVALNGKPDYTYKISLPGGYRATVTIDAVSGRFSKATVE